MKILFYLILGTLLGLCFTNANAQGEYVLNDSNNFIYNIHALTPDNHIFIYSQNSTGKGYLHKLDEDNKILWSRRMNLLDTAVEPEFNLFIKCMKSMPDNGLVLAGYFETGDFDYNLDMVVIRLDADGNTIWSKAFESSFSDEPGAMVISDTSIHIAGVCNSYRAMPSTLFYARMSFGGELYKFNTRMLQHTESVQDMAINTSGTIAILSQSLTTNKEVTGYLDVLDKEGNFKQLYPLKNISTRLFAYNLGTRNDQFIVSGTSHNANKKAQIFMLLCKNDLLGGQLDGQAYTYAENDPIYANMLLKTDNGFALGGIIQRQNGTGSKPFLMEVGKDLQIKWVNAYGSDYSQYLYTLSKRANGNIITTGSTLHSLHANDIYLIETTSEGILGCNETPLTLSASDEEILITSEAPQKFPASISSYPYAFSMKGLNFSYYENLCPGLPPIAGFTLSDSIICLGQTIQIMDASKYAYAYKWEAEGTDPGILTDSKLSPLTFKTAGKFKIRLAVSNPLGSDTAVKYVEVIELPHANAGNDLNICRDMPFEIKAEGGIHYAWYQNGTLFSTQANLNTQIQADTKFLLVAFNEKNCSDTDEVYIQVTAPPAIDKDVDTMICEGTAVSLNANIAAAGYKLHWSNGDTTPAITVDKTGAYTLEVSNECFSVKRTYHVWVNDCSLKWDLPNAFTPNQDLLNDKFMPVGQNISAMELTIFNRWGERVYSGKGNDIGWDGTFNSKPCPEGMYCYKIVIKGILGEKQFRSGTVLLLR